MSVMPGRTQDDSQARRVQRARALQVLQGAEECRRITFTRIEDPAVDERQRTVRRHSRKFPFGGCKVLLVVPVLDDPQASRGNLGITLLVHAQRAGCREYRARAAQKHPSLDRSVDATDAGIGRIVVFRH